MRRRLLIVPILTAVLAVAAVAAGGDAPSGPKSGATTPGPFHPYNVTGKYSGQFHCLVCQYGLSPVAAVFVRGTDADDGLIELLKRLDQAVNRYDRANFRCFAVFLDKDVLRDDQRAASGQDAWKDAEILFKDDDRRAELAKKLTEGVQDKAELKNIVLSLANDAGPSGWNLAKDADVTVVLYRDHEVLQSFAFKRDELKDAYAKLEPTIKKLVAQKK
jgi:hypothetical protein